MSNTEVLTIGVIAGMKVVRKAIRFPHTVLGNVEVKPFDKTLVTMTDKASEVAMNKAMGDRPGYKYWDEEGGQHGSGQKMNIKDPLDGTGRFVNGGCYPTIINADLDESDRLIACVIGEPSTGRIWMAEHDRPTIRRVFDLDNNKFLGRGVPVHTWSGELCDKATVLTDVAHGFKCKRLCRELGCDNIMTMDNSEIQMLVCVLMDKYKYGISATNGGQHGLMANGGQFMAGAITTAVGFPGELCGALLVKQAGGAMAAFQKVNTTDFKSVDPLYPLGIDLMVCGHTQRTVDRLVKDLPVRIMN